ncbi:MAG: hypothetical protein AAGB34_08055, partial [Planctomycetota bacterium]
MSEPVQEQPGQPLPATGGIIGLIAWGLCGLISIVGLTIGLSQAMVAIGIDLAILAAGVAIALSPRVTLAESAWGAAALAVSGAMIAITQAVGGISFLDGQLIIISLLCVSALTPRLPASGAIGLFGGLGVLAVLAVGASVGVAIEAARMSYSYQADAFVQQFASGTRLLFLDRLLVESVALVVLALASLAGGITALSRVSRLLAVIVAI